MFALETPLKYSSSPLSMEDMLQGPQGMPETLDSNKTYARYIMFFLYTHTSDKLNL